MICLQSGGAIEGKIVELIGEYGALRSSCKDIFP